MLLTQKSILFFLCHNYYIVNRLIQMKHDLSMVLTFGILDVTSQLRTNDD